MEKAYFCNIRSEIIPLLKQARVTISVAMAWFTSSELFQELLNCLSRKVKVELVLLDNPTNFMEFAPDFNRFIEAGGIFRLSKPENGFMHHKFCIIDNEILITGSYNWTYNAENRNIENIVISDVSSVVEEFQNEFSRLIRTTEKTDECPRLTWNEIGQRDDADYREMNYEIEYICEARNLAVQKVIKPNTTVQIIDTKRIPRAKYDIGIESIDDKGHNMFASFIAKGQELPYKSGERIFYIDSKNNTTFPCSLIYGTPNQRDSWQLIKEESLLPVAKGIADDDLEIRFSMHLDIDGNLRVDVICPKSGHTMMISSLQSDFVKYE
jgi:hypothetical protein